MEGYQPFKPNPNEIFGFTKPIETFGAPQSMLPKPEWQWILVGGILVLIFVYLYQSSQINELKSVVFRVKGAKEEV